MANQGFGGQTSGGSYSAGTLYSDGIGLPTGRAMASGSKACLITALYAYVRGNGANPVGRIRLGSAVTDPVTAWAHSDSNPGIGYFATNHWLVEGGTARFSWEGPSIGPVYFGRGGGGTVYGPGGYNRPGTLGGAYSYVQAPSAPRSLSVSGGVGTANLTWAAPSDNGESGITDYIVEYAKNSTFTSGLVRTTSSTTSKNLTGLEPVTYWFRVAARNAVTNAAGSWSVYSNVAQVTLATVPAAPAVPSAVAGPRLIHFTWAEPDDGGAPILEYQLDVATNTGYSAGLQSQTLEGLNRTVDELASGTTHYGRVRARNSVGWSAWSPNASVATPARTHQDTVGTASVHVSGGVQVELRSNGAETPTISLVYSKVTDGTGTTTIATIPTGTGSTQLGTPATLAGMALVADPAGNLYVIGRQGSNKSAILVLRYARTATLTWALSGTLSQALTNTGDNLGQFAATYVNGNILLLARRVGLIGAGNLSYAVLSTSAIAASSGDLFLSHGSDPGFLPSPPSSGTANTGLIDVYALSANRAAIAGNGFAVVDVSGGTVSSVVKSANGTNWPGQKVRVVVINASVFAVLRVNGGGINILFYNTNGALLHERTLAGSFTDQWDAAYNPVSRLLVVEYMSAARTLTQVLVNTTSYTASTPATLTASFGAASTTNSKIRLPRGPVDERHVLVTGAGVAAGVQSLSSYSDVSGNEAPSAPGLNSRGVFDATSAADFTWVFGDRNTLDTQTAYQIQIDNAATGVSAYDSGKTASTSSTKTLAAGTLTNGNTYRWRVRTYDVLDAAGAWSGYSTFPVAASGSVTITTPPSDNPVSIVNYQTIEWTYTGSTSPQARRRVRVLNHATGAVLQDTGMVTTTETSYMVTNLLSDIQQRIEVTVENAVGLTSSAGTRRVTPSFSVPETPIILTTTGISFIWVQITNPIPTGSKPEVSTNVIYRRDVNGFEDWEYVAEVGLNENYNDYAIASGVTYEYFVRGVADSGFADSATDEATAPLLEGVWLFSVDDPAGTLTGFLYGNTGRVENLSVDGVALSMVGRTNPIVEFGIGEIASIDLAFTIPSGDTHDAEMANLRELVRSRSTLCYRDNRGRIEYGIVSGLNITDEKHGSTVTAKFEASNYAAEGV